MFCFQQLVSVLSNFVWIKNYISYKCISIVNWLGTRKHLNDDFISNTPGTRGWSRLRDRTLAVAKNRAKMTLRQMIMIVNNAIFHLTRSLSWLCMSDPYITCRSLPAISAKRSTQEVTTCWNMSWLHIVLKLPSLYVMYVSTVNAGKYSWE